MMERPKEIVTIFQDVIVPEFVIRVKKETPSKTISKIELQDYFYMMLSSKSDKLSKFFLQADEG